MVIVYALQRLLALLHDEPTILREACELLLQYRNYAGVSIAYVLPGGEQIVAAAGVPADPGAAQPGTLVTLPLAIADEVAGSLTAHRTGGPGFDTQELELLQSVAEDVARAVEAVRMRILLAESAARSQPTLGRLEAFWRLSSDRAADLGWQVKAILAEGAQTLGVELALVERVEGERNSVEWTSGVPPQVDHDALSAVSVAIPVDGDPYALVFASSTPRAQPLGAEERTYIELVAALLGRLLAQHRQHEKLAALIAADHVTGLSTRAHFIDVVDRTAGDPQVRTGGMSVMLIDVDRFSELGLSFEQAELERMLRTFAGRLKGIVGEHARVAYLGGGAFAVAVHGSAERGEQLARVLGEVIALPVRIEGHELRCTASIGVALYPGDADSAEALLDAAGAALVRAQQEGGATLRFFSEDIGDALRLRRSLLQALRLAGQRAEFELYYQPVIDLADHGVGAVEALLRWRDPQYGLRLPADFIATAEEREAVLPIDEWVMREAVNRSQVLLCGRRRLRLSFNLSGSAVANAGTLPLLAAILRDEGADPSALQLEISERIAARDLASARRLADGCHALGMGVVLDNFGSGHASLALIKQLPIDVLKVDGAFVHELPHSAPDMAVVRAVIALGKSLGKRVVAEHVEREETAHWLTGEGCDAAQGYWFAEPMAQEEFLSWLSMHE